MKRSRAAASPPSSRPSTARSAISNGTRLPGGVSGSSPEGRRFLDVIHDLTSEMGGQLTHAESLQVRAVAGQFLLVEQMQAAIMKGERVDSDVFTRACNAATRSLNTLRRSAAGRAKKQPGGGAAAYLQAKREGSQP